jgi:hypothetical protein
MEYSEATASGYTLSEEDEADMEDTITMEKNYGAASGFNTFDEYLVDVYGKGMTEEIYRNCMEIQYIASGYSDYVYNSFDYTDQELEDYYSENTDKLDVISYRYFLVSSEDVDETLYDADAALEAAENEALAAAVEKAQTYLDSITDEASFIAAAADCNADLYSEEDSTLKHYRGELLGSYYKDWLLDDSRQEGDYTMTDGINGYYLVYFISHDDNHYNTVNVRHILISPEDVSEDDYDDTESYEVALDEARSAALRKLKRSMTSGWPETRLKRASANWPTNIPMIPRKAGCMSRSTNIKWCRNSTTGASILSVRRATRISCTPKITVITSYTLSVRICSTATCWPTRNA